MTTPEQYGEMLGRAAFAPLLLVGAYFLGRHLGRKKDPPRFVAWPLIGAAVLLALGALGNMNRQSASNASMERAR